MKCTICLGSGTDQQKFLCVKERLDECGDNFKVSNDKFDYEFVKDNIQALSYQFKVARLESAVETKSFQEEEVRQRSANESNFFIDICVQYLKLAERANEVGIQVKIDIQNCKFLVETYEQDSSGIVTLETSCFLIPTIQSLPKHFMVVLFLILVCTQCKSIPASCLPNPACSLT
jgi:hypothetical protein